MQTKSTTSVNYKRFFFSCNDYFLTDADDLNADINYFIQCPANVKGALKEYYTLLVDLSSEVEHIWQNIYYRCRAEISSFLTNQVYEHKLLFNLSNNELTDYINLFNQFAKQKNIRKAEESRLRAYNDNGLLAISYIKQNANFLCINFYRVTTERSTNLYSFTLKHNLKNSYNNSHLGRAHRALHWLDILEFRKLKIHYYDFCGWYNGDEDVNLLNINKFKEQFTTTKVKEYSGVIYKNKLLILLLKLFR